MHLRKEAGRNLEGLRTNEYPGRGIVIGKDETGEFLLQIYWIMGRSVNSRNRLFKAYGGRLYTEAADPAKIEDASLIIYNAMREARASGSYAYDWFVVSNGSHTDSLIERGEESLREYEYEPDHPNYTPRIVGSWLMDATITGSLTMLRKSPWDKSCDRFRFEYANMAPGFGFCIHTYARNGTPLPPFKGEPVLLPLFGTLCDIAHNYWDALDRENRISIAVKAINIATRKSAITIINKFQGKL